MKPPIFIYILMLFACRGLLILIVSLSYREYSESLLRVFYPQAYHFYLALIPIIPAMLCLIVVSRRNSLWKASKYVYFKTIPSLVVIALLADVLVQFYMLYQTNFSFSMARGLSILVAFTGLGYFFKSQYIKHLMVDWTRD